MAPRKPEEASDSDSQGERDESELSEVEEVIGAQQQPVVEAQEEYHTEESDGSDSAEPSHVDEQTNDDDEDEDGDVRSIPKTDVSLLPAHLLKALASPASTAAAPSFIPHDEMNRKEKIVERRQNRRAKKRKWDKLRAETAGTGVLEAGRAAQLKRGIVPNRAKVLTGRVGKKRALQPKSGRQMLVDSRKRVLANKSGRVTKSTKAA